VIVTSNKPFGRWGEVFGDAVAAAAMIDRLVHHAEVVSMKATATDSKTETSGGCQQTTLPTARTRPGVNFGPVLTVPRNPLATAGPDLIFGFRTEGQELSWYPSTR
jgi:hypothetical protein